MSVLEVLVWNAVEEGKKAASEHYEKCRKGWVECDCRLAVVVRAVAELKRSVDRRKND